MSTTPTTSQLDRTLHRASGAIRATATLRTAALALAWLIAAALLAVVVDALLGLNAPALVAANAVLAATVLLAVVFVMRTIWRTRYNARRVARFVEQQAGLRDSRLINAVDFADARADASTSPTLRALAIREGDRLAAGVEPTRLVDRRPAVRAMILCAAALAVILLAVLVAPRLFAMVLPRYLDPTGDHPPFTLVDFTVAVTPDKLYHGRRAVITATLAGPVIPDQASVVFVDAAPPKPDPSASRRSGSAPKAGGDSSPPAISPESAAPHRLPMLQRRPGHFELPIDRASASRSFYIDTPHGRSRRFNLTVLPVPTFDKLTVRYEYPQYTGWPPVERPLDDAGIEALVGTRVTLSIDSNLPLSMGFVTLTPDTPSESDEATVNLPPASHRPTNVAGSFTLTHSGHYSLALRAADGTMSDTAPTGPVRAIPDAPPRVSLVTPDLRVTAPVGWKVDAAFSASDDIALGRITLHILRGNAQPLALPLELKRTSVDRATGSHTIDLAALDAKPGDVIKGFATAYDNRPGGGGAGGGGAQTADSPTFELHVVSAEQYAELARQQVRIDQINDEMQKAIDAMNALDALRDQIAQQAEQLKKDLADQGDPSTATDQQKADNATKTADLAKQLDEYAKRSADLAEQMQQKAQRDPLYEFEKPAQQEYQRSASELAKQSAMAAGHRGRIAPPTPEKLDALLRDLKRADDAAQSRQAEQQMTQQQLDKLAKAEAIMSAAADLTEIAQRQRDIADRLNAARAEPNSLAPDHIARMQHLADQQTALREQLDATLKQLADAAESAEHHLPQMSASADDLVRQVRSELKVEQDQTEAAAEARNQAAGLAYMAAESAAAKLESLIAQCNGLCNSQALESLDGVLSLSRSQLANALAQMSRARGGLPRFGAGSGSGAGGQSGSTLGPAGSQTGGQQSGSLVGPHTPQRSRPSDRVGDSDSRSDAFTRADRNHPDPAPGSAERLHADHRTGDRLAPSNPDPAPARFRPLIDAYFKRLADDSR